MDKIDLAKRITACCLLKGKFKLRSGKTSPFYFDKYRFEGNPVLLEAIAEELQKLLPVSFDAFAGLELGGIPLATVLSLRTRKPCIYVRKAAKTYGTCNLVEGGVRLGEKVVVVEDVITTGGQVLESIGHLRKLGLNVSDVICVIDRQEGGLENLRRIGCSLKSVFTKEDLEVI